MSVDVCLVVSKFQGEESSKGKKIFTSKLVYKGKDPYKTVRGGGDCEGGGTVRVLVHSLQNRLRGGGCPLYKSGI